jgi:hypothetical protein
LVLVVDDQMAVGNPEVADVGGEAHLLAILG